MTKKIKGDLILTKDTSFDESIEVEGNIKGYYNLKVEGNINAGDIVAWNIVAWDIDARNIAAWDIVFCETVKVKGKLKAKAVIRKRFKLEQKEFKSD